MNIIEISAPLNKELVKNLKVGQELRINGTIFAARDSAHKRLTKMLDEGIPLPFDIKNQIIYYVGPCPAREGHVIGSAGPTTSSRMDAYAPRLISLGLAGMIGKGLRSNEVVDAMKEYGAVYFGAIGGAGALISKTIIHEEVVAFDDLGPEALRKLTVKDMPVTVIIDCYGNNLYEDGKKTFRRI